MPVGSIAARVVDGGGRWLLPRLTGWHNAKEPALLAEVISAKQAVEIGMVAALALKA